VAVVENSLTRRKPCQRNTLKGENKMTKEEIKFIKELLEYTMECSDEIQLDVGMCEIVEKFLKNLWKIKAYDKIIEKNT
jgi:hypothetical protein